jgi:hypothetical protein
MNGSHSTSEINVNLFFTFFMQFQNQNMCCVHRCCANTIFFCMRANMCEREKKKIEKNPVALSLIFFLLVMVD